MGQDRVNIHFHFPILWEFLFVHYLSRPVQGDDPSNWSGTRTGRLTQDTCLGNVSLDETPFPSRRFVPVLTTQSQDRDGG